MLNGSILYITAFLHHRLHQSSLFYIIIRLCLVMSEVIQWGWFDVGGLLTSLRLASSRPGDKGVSA